MYPVFADEVEVVLNFLRTHPYVTTYSPTVAGNLRGYAYPERRITVQTTGGNVIRPQRLSAPRLDINTYAEDEYTAKNLCLAVTAALRNMRGHTVSNAIISRVETSTPADLTDPINNSPRFVAEATIYIATKQED